MITVASGIVRFASLFFFFCECDADLHFDFHTPPPLHSNHSFIVR